MAMLIVWNLMTLDVKPHSTGIGIVRYVPAA